MAVWPECAPILFPIPPAKHGGSARMGQDMRTVRFCAAGKWYLTLFGITGDIHTQQLSMEVTFQG